ncbi:Flp pilus assembly protein CpaB [Ramlibacter sp. AW1]|uniref:Flp pilus assembly protein CpaB n=1 Tax=Ramlibacter aurantiacus TaxID=2801330 RepID=A0A937D2B7_9BURK|nr:Flp pilus assembly protein CpaB [Ramlibacter aurantiacus]MBL0419585.1 Flp pilus assembly protein CpaB [Ramlibacter aurantiacus]
MRNAKALFLLALAVIFGLAAAYYATLWVAQRGTIQSSKVAVAALDIELGSRITPQMLTLVDWPAGSLPPGAFDEVAKLQDRVVKQAIPRGDAVLERKLSPPGTQGGLSAVIAEGKRAMTVRVNDVVGVAGFALPGNYVDVMVNTQKDQKAGAESQISVTVLEQVLVLAVAQEAGRDDTKPKVVSAVTLELSPDEAERLDLARNVGTLSLVLRNQLDKESVATKGITRDQLLGLQKPVAPVPAPQPRTVRVVMKAEPPPVAVMAAPPAPRRDCVEIISHGNRSVSCF